ncbi:hypothetical protein BDD12DRAFT_872605 [Trichophaea hybrida]|nr:hypothetical protein BDD12DRAFT_872605 [Trichophaea hybrida]
MVTQMIPIQYFSDIQVKKMLQEIFPNGGYTYRESYDEWVMEVPRKIDEKNPLEMHMIILSSASENWRAYFNSLEEYFLKTTTNAVNYLVDSKLLFDRSHPDSKKQNQGVSPSTLEVSFEDVQLLQKFEETSLNDAYHKFSDPDDDASWDTFNAALECYLLEMASYKRNVENLLRRVHGRSRLLYNVLEFQTQETVSCHSQFTTTLQEKGRKNSDLMIQMNKKTVGDAVGMKILTFLAMLYLPLNFVMTFLQSSIIRFLDSSDRIDFHQVQFSKEGFVIFLALSIALLLLTLGTWFVWNKLEIANVRKSLDKSIA